MEQVQFTPIILSVLVTVIVYGIRLGVKKLNDMSIAFVKIQESLARLETHIEKKIEMDISDMKQDIKVLYSKVNRTLPEKIQN